MNTNRLAVLPLESNCRICALLSGAQPRFEYDKAWAEDEGHIALASVGALVPGWSLVFPKKHSLNLAENFRLDVFWKFAEQARAIVESRYGHAVIFEHGCQSSASQTSCGTAHAHLHVVPFKTSLTAAAKEYDSSLTWMPCLASQLSDYVAGREYLFVADNSDGEHTSGFVSILAEGRSQFFRRVISQFIGRPEEFDYKIFPQTEVANKSASSLRDIQSYKQASAA